MTSERFDEEQGGWWRHIRVQPSIRVDESLREAVALFRADPRAQCIAVVDADGRPCGLIREACVRLFLFNAFGHALLANKGLRNSFASLVQPCRQVEKAAAVGALIGVAAEAVDGVVVTDAGRYVGVLPVRELLMIAAERDRSEFARRLGEADAQAARTAGLERAFGQFDHDASVFAHALAATAERLGGAAAETAHLAQHAQAGADAVTRAADEGSLGAAEVWRSASSLSTALGKARELAADVRAAVGQTDTLVEITSEKAEALAAAAEDIGEVVGFIEDVAGKVNLLAINATIEAARAGGAGRGFGVVASEIRSLARRTREATRRIGARVETIRGASGDAAAIQLSIARHVAEVRALAGQIAGTVDDQAVSAQQIAAVASRAAETSAGISENVADIGRRAADADEAASGLAEMSRGLSAQALAMRRGVDAFIATLRAA